MNIALTGANGFIGKIIREGLEQSGHRVVPCRTDKDDVPSDINCLIHCARSHKNLTVPGQFVEYDNNPDYEQWIAEFTTDVYLAYDFTMKMVVPNPELKNIIFISSIYGIKPPTVRYIPMNYNVCKAAEIHLSKCLAVQLAPKIRCNCIIYGGVHSDREVANQTPEFREKYNAKTLIGHMVMPDEVAGAVKFLASDESKGMTGSCLMVEGGYLV